MYSIMHATHRVSEDHAVSLREAIPNLQGRQTQLQIAHLVVQPLSFHQLRVVDYALRTLLAAMDAAASTFSLVPISSMTRTLHGVFVDGCLYQIGAKSDGSNEETQALPQVLVVVETPTRSLPISACNSLCLTPNSRRRTLRTPPRSSKRRR